MSLPNDSKSSQWDGELEDEKRQYRKQSTKIQHLESTIEETLEQRRRLTVFARRVVATECPRTYPKTEEEIAFLDKVLIEDEQFVFCDFTKKQRQFMLDILEKDSSVKKGDLLYTVGDVGEYFYIIDKGTVDILDGFGSDNRVLQRGGAFGEVALLFDVPRVTTARARIDCVLWKMHQHSFRAKLAHHAMSKEEEMVALLRPLPLFENMEEASLRKFANAMERLRFEKGERIAIKGGVGNIGYIIDQGTVIMSDNGVGDSKQMDVEISAGDTFGVRALLTGESRHCNFIAKTSVMAWAVDRETFETLFGPLHNAIEHQMKRRLLQAIPMFANSDATSSELDSLVERMTELCFKKGHHFNQVGKPRQQELIIIQSGRIAVYDGTEEGGEVFVLKGGDVYGDKYIREKSERLSCNNVICEENTTVWALQRHDMEEIIGDFKRLGQTLNFEHSRRVSMYFDNRISLKDLDRVKILGAGGFGKVWLVKHKETANHYALKELNKRKILTKNQTKNVLREKDILATIEHPFILGEVSSFQDETNLYILTNLVEGGELYSIIANAGEKGLPMESAVFYGACVHAALAHLHDRNICYRDLKVRKERCTTAISAQRNALTLS